METAPQEALEVRALAAEAFIFVAIPEAAIRNSIIPVMKIWMIFLMESLAAVSRRVALEAKALVMGSTIPASVMQRICLEEEAEGAVQEKEKTCLRRWMLPLKRRHLVPIR